MSDSTNADLPKPRPTLWQEAQEEILKLRERITELKESLKATLTKCATIERQALNRAEQAEAKNERLKGLLRECEVNFVDYGNDGQIKTPSNLIERIRQALEGKDCD